MLYVRILVSTCPSYIAATGPGGEDRMSLSQISPEWPTDSCLSRYTSPLPSTECPLVLCKEVKAHGLLKSGLGSVGEDVTSQVDLRAAVERVVKMLRMIWKHCRDEQQLA